MNFSHIYVEHDIFSDPISQAILTKYPHAQIITIDDYKQFFNRKNQNFILQRKSRKLILAKQKQHFTFLGTERVRSFGNKHIYSCSMIRNCKYHCEYCFLSGMHESAHIVLYVNIEDYKREVIYISETIQKEHPQDSVYLITSYLSDLPAFEELYPLCKTWINIVETLPNIELEIRSKSDAYNTSLRNIPASKKAILVWSFSPPHIIRQYEHGTASFHTRILQTKAAIEDGWRVRLCFDPIIYSPQWQKEYSESLKKILQYCPPESIEAISYGAFRMSKNHLQKMRKDRPVLSLLQKNIEIKHSLGTYAPSILKEIQEEFLHEASKYFPKEKIHFVHG